MPGHVRKPACSLCQPQPLVWPVLLQVLHAFMMICITDIFLISGSPCTIAHHCCLRKTLSDLDLCLGELDIWCCRRACVSGESGQCCCRLSMNHSETSLDLLILSSLYLAMRTPSLTWSDTSPTCLQRRKLLLMILPSLTPLAGLSIISFSQTDSSLLSSLVE